MKSPVDITYDVDRILGGPITDAPYGWLVWLV